MVTELRVLEVPLHDALFANVFLRRSNHSFHGNSFDLAVIQVILSEVWWVGLARMAILPGISARGAETRRLYMRGHVADLLVSAFIIAEIEKAGRGPTRIGLALAFRRSLRFLTISSLLPASLLFEPSHFTFEVRLIFSPEENGDVLLDAVILLGEVELLLVPRRVAEA